MATSLFGVGSSILVNVAGTVTKQNFTASAGQTVFNLTSFAFVPNTGSLLVFINGSFQTIGTDFTESSTGTAFTLLEAVEADDVVIAVGFPEIDLTAVNASSIFLDGTYTLADFISDSGVIVTAPPYYGDIQAAIDALPSTGGSIGIPSDADISVDTIKLDGTLRNKSGVCLVSLGGNPIIRQNGTARAAGVPGGDPTQSPNLIDVISGSGHKIRGLTLIGNKDTGGIKPATATNWAINTVYTYDSLNPLYKQTKSDGTPVVSEAASDKVWKLLVSHTSDPADIDVDVALGRWEQVTDYAALNGWYYDESFTRNHVISITGPIAGSKVDDVTVEGCTISGGAYAGILRGSGPANAGLQTAGCTNVKIIGNTISNCAAGVGGLNSEDVVVTGNDIQATGNVINVDQNSTRHTISGNIIHGDSVDGARNGVSSYRSDNVTVNGNVIYGVQVGVNFQDTGSISNKGGAISGNIIIDAGQVGSSGGGTAISAGSSDHVAITGNQITNPIFNGIKVSDSNNTNVTGNTLDHIGAYGIDFEDVVGFACTGNTVHTAGRDCYYFEGARSGSVSGNLGINGNEDNSGTLYSGIRIGQFTGPVNSSNIVVVGNTMIDTRGPHQQHYGLNIEAGTTGVGVMMNNFTGNADGEWVNAGTMCPIGFNLSSGSGAWKTEAPILPIGASVDIGASTAFWRSVYSNKISLTDGIVAPPTVAGIANIYVDTADGDLKVKFGDGVTKTIVVDT